MHTLLVDASQCTQGGTSNCCQGFCKLPLLVARSLWFANCGSYPAQEVDRAIEMTVSHVNKLREMSPLWEMVQEGVDIKSIQWSQH